MTIEVLQILEKAEACLTAVAWVHELRKEATPEEVWNACHRGDWLLWLLHQFAVHEVLDRRHVTRAICAVVELAPTDHPLALKALEQARQWVDRGCPNEERMALQDVGSAAFEASNQPAVMAAGLAALSSRRFTSDAIHAAELVLDDADDGPGRVERAKEMAKVIRAVVPWQEVKDAAKEFVKSQ